jgi:transposase
VLIGFGRHRDKVSTIAAISVAPHRRRIGLYWRTDPETYINAEAVVEFIRGLLRHLRGKVIVIWDGGSNHKGPLVREFLAQYPRLHLERLPGYAPDLNQVEMIWSHLKYGLLVNFLPRHVQHLDTVVNEHLEGIDADAALIQSLWKGSRLPFVEKALLT